MWTDSWIRRKKKHSAAPLGIELGSSHCRSDTLTTELQSHDMNCVQLSVHICRMEKERSLTIWNGPDRNEFRFGLLTKRNGEDYKHWTNFFAIVRFIFKCDCLSLAACIKGFPQRWENHLLGYPAYLNCPRNQCRAKERAHQKRNRHDRPSQGLFWSPVWCKLVILDERREHRCQLGRRL